MGMRRPWGRACYVTYGAVRLTFLSEFSTIEMKVVRSFVYGIVLG